MSMCILLVAIDWKPDLKACFTRAGFKFDLPAVSIADDAIANNQSETRAGADRFGREKRFEHTRLDLSRNAGAVVHDFHDELIVVKRSAHTYLSRAIDGGDGVIQQIGPDLVEFAAISQDARHG